MRSLRPAAMSTNHCPHRLLFALALTVVFSISAAAQQPTGRQKIPRLTTDDVSAPAPPLVESTEKSKPEDAGKVPAEGQVKPGETKVSEEESSWRDRVGKARGRAKELERSAEQAELRITQLRNELGASGQSARYRNETAAELDQAGQRTKDRRAQARSAVDDLAQLVEYGRQNGFAEGAGPKPVSEDGKPNDQYYRSQLARLTDAIESAQRRIQLYDNRVRDLSQRILMNGGKKGGDNFYAIQLQQDREDAQQKLDESRVSLAKAQSDLEALREEARRAGVTPDLFR